MLAPKDFTPAMLRPLAANEYYWQPERSSSGPITIVMSSADQVLYVGDRLDNDVRPAQEAGMATALMSSRFTKLV